MPDFGLPNYPQPFGSRWVNVTNHNGPLLYVAGGETVNANTFGWGSFDTAIATSPSANNVTSGNFTVQVLLPIGQAANNVTGANNCKLKWLQSNGTEVANNANLSLEYVRMEYRGG